MDLKKLISVDELKKRYSRVNVYDARSEVGYQAKRTGVSFVVRKAGDLSGQLVEGSADLASSLLTNTVGSVVQFFLGAEIARNLGLFAGAVGGNMVGIAGLGLASGISAGFAQADYVHQKKNLLRHYSEELGAKLGKPASQVTLKDMDALAEDNQILREELRRARKQRNYSIPVAIIGTLASFAAVTVLLPELFLIAGIPAMTGVMGFMVRAGISMLAYTAIKNPMNLIGDKVFGLQHETVNDRIVEIQRAHAKHIAIQPEDLVPLLINANHTLEETIIRENGKPFDALSSLAQKRISYELSVSQNLEGLARDLNSGSMKASELMFELVGDESGIPRLHSPDHVPHIAEQVQTMFADKIAQKKPTSYVERITQEALTNPTITLH